MRAEMPFMKSNEKHQVKIPRSQAELKRPVDQRHAFLRIEKENVWIRSLDRRLAETFCSLVTQGDPVTVARTAGVVVWGTYAGEPENTGSIILDHKPDGRFKLVPLSVTSHNLLTEVAHLIARPDSVTSEERKNRLIFRGELKKSAGLLDTEPKTQQPQPEVAPAADAPAGAFEMVTGPDAIAAIGQKVTMEIIDRGVKIRIRGRQADCENTAKLIIKGRPTVASQQGAKYMIEGNLNKSFLRDGASQQGPDENGVYTRQNSLERTFTALGENLTAVQAACEAGCKEGTMFTIVIIDRSAESGHFVISSGRKRIV
ncbi:MAG: hypothetical protein JW837_06250 [Sedimentisphaerales bacterium]|nr:hypothetical protein [Sedimentisphaerales bacterium]